MTKTTLNLGTSKRKLLSSKEPGGFVNLKNNIMTDKEFLAKYGNEKVEFSSIYKFKVTYKNEELKIWCSGIIESRDRVDRTETVYDIYNLDDFCCGFLPS